MLRIRTFLRDAFERPPEREGREVWFAKTGESSDVPDRPSKPDGNGDDATKPQRDAIHNKLDAVINSATEKQEEPEKPMAGDDDGSQKPPEGEIQAGEEPQEPEATRIRIKADILVEKASSALETIVKIKAIFGNKEFMDKIREAAKRDNKIQDLLLSFEEDVGVCDDVEKIIQNLKSEAEKFVIWQNPEERKLSPNKFAAANVRSRCIVLKPNSPEKEELERQLQRGVYDYLSDPTVTDKMDSDEHWNALSVEEKTPMIDRIEELTHIDETLQKMDERLAEYDAGLKIYLNKIQQLKDDIEQGKEISPPQQEWGGSFNLKLIHFVYLAMAVKKIYDTWKRQWEYDFDRAVSDCAAAISPWVAPNTVTQRLHQEQEENMRKVKESFKKVYERFTFTELHGALQAPHPDPAVKLAQLEVAAERGWLYSIVPGMTPEQTLIFGKQLGTSLPSSWSSGQKASYVQDIITTNSSAGKRREQAGIDLADRYKKGAWLMFPSLENALKEHDYHFARGIMKRALLKGDLGHTPTWATLKLINMLRKNRCTYMTGDLLKTFGNMVVQPDFGAPQSYLLLTTKFLAPEYEKLIGKGATPGEIFLDGDAKPIAAAIVKAEELITAHGGPSFDQKEKTYTGQSSEEQLEHAVSKLLAGKVVYTADGTTISLYDEAIAEFSAYRNMVQQSSERYSSEISLTRMDTDYTNDMGELFLLDRTILAPLFAAGTNGVLPRGKQVDGIFAQIDAEAIRLKNSPQLYNSFIRAMQERFEEPFLIFLQHRNAAVGLAELNHLPKIIRRLELRIKIEDLIREEKIIGLTKNKLLRVLNTP